MLFLWLIGLGIVASAVASYKGKSPFLWFWIGALFFPAIIILLVQKDDDSPAAENGAVYVRACPYCKEKIRADAIKCKHCHSTVEPVEIAIPGDDEPRQKTIAEYEEEARNYKP